MRAVGVHVEVDDDPFTVAERVALVVRRCASPPRHAPVDGVESLGDTVEVGAERERPRLCGEAEPQLVVLGEPRHRRGRELRLVGEAGGVGDGTATRPRLEQQPVAAAGRRHEDRRIRQRRAARIGLHERPRAGPVAHRGRDRGTAGQRRRTGENDLPAGERWEDVEHGPRDGALPRRELDDDEATLPGRGEGRRVDAERDRLVVAGEPLGRPLDRALRRAEERVDPGQELRALVLARGHRDPLGGEKRGGRRRLGLDQSGRREAGQPGLEAVHDVELAEREGGRQVRAHAHRQRDAVAQRFRDGCPDRDRLSDDTTLQRPAALEQVGGTRRRGDDRDRVAAAAQCLGGTADVLVDVVWL